MKNSIKLFLVVIFSAWSVQAGVTISRSNVTAPDFLDDIDLRAHPDPTIINPYRVINGTTNVVTDKWISFSGTVTQVHPGEGLRVTGYFTGQQTPGSDFLLVNYPYKVAEGDQVGGSGCKAVDGGIYTYSTAAGSSRTLHKLDYGKVWTPPPLTAEQIAAMKAKNAAAKKSATEKALQYNQDLADKGDAYGLMRMGERYRDGNGVDKDLPTARGYLEKAKAAGSEQAGKELEALPAS